MKEKWRAALCPQVLVVTFACGLSAGCLPVNQQYQRVEVADAKYLQGLCGGSGPPNWTYYPYHGIFISVSLSPLQIGLHYPAGTTVSLDGDVLTISGAHQSGPIQLTALLTPAIHGALGNGVPEEFDGMSDPLDPGRKSGYHRSAKGSDSIWASFIGRDVQSPNHLFRVPTDLDGAKVTIPPITINGQKYGPEELLVIRKKYSGIVPINC